MMGIFRSMAGMVTVQLTSADIAGSLAGVNALGIPVFDVQIQEELTARFRIYRRDYHKIAGLAQRSGDQLRIAHRKGLYWQLKELLQRPILVAAIALLAVLALLVPSRVLFVQVAGNDAVPTNLILAAAEDCGIGFGASRREVRSEKMKNALLSAVPQLQWAGVNTYGCVAVISVRERSITEEAAEETGVSSIVAARDGVILSCTVTRGSGLCAAGQAVKEGETLISGYTDCGLCVTATRAEGEILALTRRNLTIKTPAQRQIRTSVEKQTTNFSLIIGKKRINFYKGSGISDASCVKMYSKYVLTLPGGFELPVTFVKETVITCASASEEIPEEELTLTDFAFRYLQQQMVAGSITDRIETVTFDDGVYCMTGEYACTEMIGKRQQEQIGEIP